MNQSFLRSAAILGTSLLATAAFAQTLYVPSGTVGNITGSNVGVGTNAPLRKLHIYEPVGWTELVLESSYSASANGRIWGFMLNPTNGQLVFRAGNSTLSSSNGVMILDPAGNVGIGISSPSGYGKLAVAGTIGGTSPDLGTLATLQSDNSGLTSIGSWRNAANTQIRFNTGNSAGLFTEKMRIDQSGNVGIGTAAPTSKLQIGISNAGSVNEGLELARLGGATSKVGLKLKSNAGGYYRGVLEFTPNGGTAAEVLTFGNEATGNPGVGCVGIGTDSPVSKLTVYGPSLNPSLAADNGILTLWGTNTAQLSIGSVPGAPYGLYLQAKSQWSNGTTSYPILLNPVGGNVGIGTTNPTNKLEVAGTIRAKEVIVETTGWSDYVFASDYRLAPLSEVEAHIAAKGHLPGIPSAAEVATQGVSVGDMQAKLLAKVEEMTLHLIAQEKRIAQLEAENAVLKRSQP
jgi:hypothetical protein